jgi:hypothetical protein
MGDAALDPIPPPPPRERRWIPPILLTLVILVVVFGGYFVAVGAGLDRAAGAGTTPESVAVGGIRFTPEPGWVVVRELPGRTPGVQLTRGIGNLLVLVIPEEADPGAALDAYVEEVLRLEAVELQIAEEEEIPMPQGVTALRRFYVGTFADDPAPLEGDVTALVLPGGPAVVFDGWANEGAYRGFAPQVHTMAATTEHA